MKTYNMLTGLIQYLQGHAVLGAYIYPTVFDDASQVDAVAVVTQGQDFTVIVTPGELTNTNPADGTRRWALPISVTVMASVMVAQEELIGVMEMAITHLHGWEQSELPSTTPQLQSVADLDLASIPQLQNLRGKTITLTTMIVL